MWLRGLSCRPAPGIGSNLRNTTSGRVGRQRPQLIRHETPHHPAEPLRRGHRPVRHEPRQAASMALAGSGPSPRCRCRTWKRRSRRATRCSVRISGGRAGSTSSWGIRLTSIPTRSLRISPIPGCSGRTIQHGQGRLGFVCSILGAVARTPRRGRDRHAHHTQQVAFDRLWQGALHVVVRMLYQISDYSSFRAFKDRGWHPSSCR